MTYSVKEIYKTIQGEGGQMGRTAIFCRFAGCNLWSGREQDRATAACTFCDTDFVGTDGTGGGTFTTAPQLADAIMRKWKAEEDRKLVVFTGGEPLLQLDAKLIEAMHNRHFQIAVETNGTIAAPPGIDWICVSPKAGTTLRQIFGKELKLVYPQTNTNPADYEVLNFEHFFLQPMDGPQREENTAATIAYCMDHPRWRLSLQTHKYIGIA